MILNALDKYRDFGLLLLRIGAGLYLALGHGWGKMAGGPEFWADHGQTMNLFGLGFLPSFWGFMSSFAEFFCALLVVLGLLFRPALILLILNMAVAATMHLSTGRGSPEQALMYGLVFLTLLFTGPGKYSLDTRLFESKRSLDAKRKATSLGSA